MLAGAGDADGDVEGRGDDLAGEADLRGDGVPTEVADGATGADGAAEDLRQLLERLEALGGTETAATGANRYGLTSADGGAAGSPDTRPQIIYNLPTGYTRPFIWVRDSEKAGINAKISGNAWEPGAARAMAFGAKSWSLTRSTDDPLLFRQASVWEDRADFDRH